MHNPPFVIENPAIPIGFRYFSLIVGVPLLFLGFLGIYRIPEGIAGVGAGDISAGWFAVVMVMIILLILVGSATVWAFLIPYKLLVISEEKHSVTMTRRYPFGVIRNSTFALDELAPPEVFFDRDADAWEGGNWKLKVTLPDGHKVTCSSDAWELEAQKAEVEALRSRLLQVLT